MMNSNGSNKESNGAPQPDKWYNLTLGSSFQHKSSSKFFTLRYEFKPASIDKNQAGLLHKNKENRVNVEFNNNQPGKPKVSFEGSTEDYKDNDGVLFFDSGTFRLERLHRAVKRLRHVRLPGESAAPTAISATTTVWPAMESRLSPIGKAAKSQLLNKPVVHSVPLEVERIDIGKSESPGAKPTAKSNGYLSVPPNPSIISPNPNNYVLDENIDLVVDDDGATPNKTGTAAQEANSRLDINVPNQNQNDTDEEIADVDVSNDEADKGPNAAEALRAQVNAEGRVGQTSSSGGTSGSGSSVSSSSDSEGSEDDSVSSGGDVEI
ncbi:uncharacterized protein LOC143854707 [Tasmannia lanceolata]|uniref:uncharacterized protein LOC143854707 n=1 Tax=Tasmannia lanceolata TaxID=3420 RepID=UPI0040631021